MTTSVSYPIHRAIGRPVQFKGFKGPYIIIAAISLVVDLLLFVLVYLCGIPPWICVILALGLGAAALTLTGQLSHRFGSAGLQKWLLAKQLPTTIRYRSRRTFNNTYKNHSYDEGKEKEALGGD
jgi:Domain of unknown function (DUF4133)